MVLVLGGLMLMVGLAFKLSAVPFHFWAPDVFEGAAAEVGAFLSVASKAAALGLLARLAVAFGYIGPDAGVAQIANLPGQVANLPHVTEVLEPARQFMAGLVMLLAAVTCTFGNLAAYGQTNMKRLLAYSTIAHAGYMMMPVAAAVVLMGRSPADAADAVAAMAFYVGIYLFMNLGAFAIVAFLRNKLGSEEIADYAGLVRRSPGVAVCFAIILFSLVGLPPLAGFSAKFAIFSYVFEADLLGLLLIGVLEHRAEPVLLSPRRPGDDVRRRARGASGGGNPAGLRARGLLPGGDAAAFGAFCLVGRLVRPGQDGRHPVVLRSI